MEVTLKNTSQTVEIAGARGGERLARVWEGQTSTGVRVQFLVMSVAAESRPGVDLSEFERELDETSPPEGERAFPLRMLI